MFSSCFCFDLFLLGFVLSFRGIMASASNDKEKMPSEDDHQDPKLKEEVESEAEEEEIEEEQHSCTRSIIASIGVVMNPRHTLAPRTSSLGNHPFHTLIHEHQFQQVPRSRLPSRWDIDRSNSVGKDSSNCEKGWGNNSKSWNSPPNMFMSHSEHNLKMIRNLTYKIDELSNLIEKLIKDSTPPPKE
jgi:hypothetical protein